MILFITGLWQRLKGWIRKKIDFLIPGQQESYIPSETESLCAQLKTAQDKLAQAWQNLNYAEKQYVDIAIIEINLAETEFSHLHRKYRLFTGETPDPENALPDVTVIRGNNSIDAMLTDSF